ncbi:Tripartite tricarboxylate transporter family receptor [compost metagenome]
MVLAPAGTPAAIVAKISQDISAIVRTEAVRAQFKSMGLEALGGTPEEALLSIQAEHAYWKNLVKTFSTAEKPSS